MIDIERKIIGLIKRAKDVLELENVIIINIVEDAVKFPTASNACELSGNKLYVNKNWIDRVLKENDETELRFLIYHEVRHFYQAMQVELWKNEQPTQEAQIRVMRWDYERKNYIRNVNENIDYYTQEIEIDANAFGILMFNFDINNGVENISGDLTSIPDEVVNLVIDRVEELSLALKYKLS